MQVRNSVPDSFAEVTETLIIMDAHSRQTERATHPAAATIQELEKVVCIARLRYIYLHFGMEYKLFEVLINY